MPLLMRCVRWAEEINMNRQIFSSVPKLCGAFFRFNEIEIISQIDSIKKLFSFPFSSRCHVERSIVSHRIKLNSTMNKKNDFDFHHFFFQHEFSWKEYQHHAREPLAKRKTRRTLLTFSNSKFIKIVSAP